MTDVAEIVAAVGDLKLRGLGPVVSYGQFTGLAVITRRPRSETKWVCWMIDDSFWLLDGKKTEKIQPFLKGAEGCRRVPCSEVRSDVRAKLLDLLDEVSGLGNSWGIHGDPGDFMDQIPIGSG
jgi:hypothetical protein